jgi:NADPH:quinone reductase-like Zn-dependent oxidoreductase
MRAIVYHTYGSPDVLELKEVEKPTPKDDEVLVSVQAASVNALDWHLLTSDVFLVRLNSGLTKPKLQILGADIAGRVEAVGRNVKQLRPGDDVFGDIFDSGLGGFAEYVCTREDALVPKPANLSFEEAAAIPVAALTALQGLRNKGQIQSGQKVLINGASGGVGTFAVQIAKAFGAEVTAVCSTQNIDTVNSLGADQVIDYTKEDFTKKGQQYDLILGVNGYHPILDYKRSLTPKGRYIMSGGTMAQFGQAVLLGPLISLTGSQKMGNFMAKANRHDLLVLKELVEAGKVKPVIDKRFPLSETAEAMRYLGAGHARGKVIITVDQHNDIPLKSI